MAQPHTNETYFAKVSKKYNNKFLYFNDYTGIKNKIKVKCIEHGIFYVSADNHLHGKNGGCKKCQMEKHLKKYTTVYSQEFLTKSNIIHENKYNYSKMNYINNCTNITIICPIHGEFEQSPTSHLNGRGCHKCGQLKQGGYGQYDLTRAERFKEQWSTEKYFIYVVRLFNEHENFIKVGLTNKPDIKSRFNGVCPYKRQVLFYSETNLYHAIQIEQMFHKNTETYKCKLKFKGYTECYKLETIENIKNTLLEAQLEIKYLE